MNDTVLVTSEIWSTLRLAAAAEGYRRLPSTAMLRRRSHSLQVRRGPETRRDDGERREREAEEIAAQDVVEIVRAEGEPRPADAGDEGDEARHEEKTG